MKVLLDTCVLSELRRPKTNPTIYDAVNSISSDNLYISVISIGEITKGINLLDKSKRKAELKKWVQGIEQFYSERILTIDLETTCVWGELTAGAQRKGQTIPVSDGLIAATARHHGLHIMTRNVSDFKPTGAMIINPWDE